MGPGGDEELGFFFIFRFYLYLTKVIVCYCMLY